MSFAEHDRLMRLARARIGTVIDGKYTLEDVLGVGGAGAVYRAKNTWVGRECAVKLFHYEGANQAAQEKRFVREAQAVNRIRKDGRAHPNVVDAIDVGRDGATSKFFVVQELLRGETLANRMARQPDGRVEFAEAASLMIPVIDAIASAHDAGIVHRDLKPENVFLVDQGSNVIPLPKVLDFGIAQLADMRMTQSSELMGTPDYMPPEAFFGARDVDARADVWALGVVLYELVAGHTPFRADGASMFVVMQAIAQRDAPSLLDAGLMRAGPWAVVKRCLSKDLSVRYANGRAVLEALDEVLTTV